jgi:hypothetical protein
MTGFAQALSQQQIQQGFSLLKLMEHLDREMAQLNEQRLISGLADQERERLTRIKRSHLRKIHDCIAELESSGFNQWLMERRTA